MRGLTNSSNRRQKNVFYIYLFLTLVCVAFIFGNSLSDGEESGRQSGKIVQVVVKAAEFFNIRITDVVLLSHIVRKSAHFLEFALLGALTFMTLRRIRICRYAQVYFSVSFCLLIAACDEYIQTFRSGRSGQVSDVFLDLSGSATAIALCILFCFLRERKMKKEAHKKENANT